MGKFRDDSSDNQMDIEHPMPQKKKKIIVKKTLNNRNKKTNQRLSVSTKATHNDLVHSFSKKVNMKNKAYSLQHKQNIFNKIVNGLKDKNGASKKNKKKSRVLLKKELRKSLQLERIHRKSSGDMSEGKQMQQEKIVQKKKKKQFNERQKVAQFQQLMGTGLQNLRDIVAKNVFAHKQ